MPFDLIHLEMTEIQTRLLRNGGPAVLFEKSVMPDGSISPIPCLANLFGTVKRVAMGVTLEGKARTTAGELREVGELLAFLRHPDAAARPGRRHGDAAPGPDRHVHAAQDGEEGAVQEVVLKGDQIDLTALPIQTCWPGEPAPLITWPLVVTKGPSDDREDDFNLGIYRMQVLGKDKAIMRWLAHRGGAQHYQRWQKAGKREPLPCRRGARRRSRHDPGRRDAGAGHAVGVPVRRPDARLQGRAGRVQDRAADGAGPGRDRAGRPRPAPTSSSDEGPYGDHTGYYNSVETVPGVQVSAITMRKDPIYLTTFTGRPPDEPSVLGEALNEVFIPLIQPAVPRDRRLLAAARGLQLPHRRGVDEEGLSRSRQARDDGRVELPAPVHVHQVGDRGGRRHHARDWKDVMWAAVDPHGPGARHHGHREHPDRLSGLRLARERPRLQDRPRRHRQVGARDQARMGPQRSAWTTR
jgi:4-hydroxy-3-polyprenylbenzoate decarboxylase